MWKRGWQSDSLELAGFFCFSVVLLLDNRFR